MDKRNIQEAEAEKPREAPSKDAKDEEDKVENDIHAYGSKNLRMPNTSEAPTKEAVDTKKTTDDSTEGDAKVVNIHIVQFFIFS